jgi:hypothetical protein
MEKDLDWSILHAELNQVSWDEVTRESDMPRTISHATDEEKAMREDLAISIKQSPIPNQELLMNLPLYLRRQELMHLLFLTELYQTIVNVHGSIMEFGCRWGRNLATLINLRGIYEPYNWGRKIIGFDTFEGVQGAGDFDKIEDGDYGVSNDYDIKLAKIIDYHNENNPISHIVNEYMVKGDVRLSLPAYLEDYPETIIALAYLDLDIYKPTIYVLEKILECMARGGIVVFDELNHHQFPGETEAFLSSSLSNKKLYRSPFSGTASWVIV